mmetsp:Transcript_104411/g.207366  ORF Transcript_104411/g.207366 Transcript_104411/m.207366 type:complete len:232 (-) Transcript_104411:671-1366(-)
MAALLYSIPGAGGLYSCVVLVLPQAAAAIEAHLVALLARTAVLHDPPPLPPSSCIGCGVLSNGCLRPLEIDAQQSRLAAQGSRRCARLRARGERGEGQSPRGLGVPAPLARPQPHAARGLGSLGLLLSCTWPVADRVRDDALQLKPVPETATPPDGRPAASVPNAPANSSRVSTPSWLRSRRSKRSVCGAHGVVVIRESPTVLDSARTRGGTVSGGGTAGGDIAVVVVLLE